MEQRVKGTLEIWANPFTPSRVPKVFHLRRDPYERADLQHLLRLGAVASLYSRAGASPMSGNSWRPPGRNRRASPSAGRWRRWRNRCRGCRAISTRTTGAGQQWERGPAPMSALGHERTLERAPRMSASPPRADMLSAVSSCNWHKPL